MEESQRTSDDSSITSTKQVQPVVGKEAGGQQQAPLDPEKGNVAATLPSDPNDWNGPDDPQNPLNWSKWKKYCHVISPALMAFTASIGTSIYSPGVSSTMVEFNISSTVALLPLSFYVLALGFGPLIGAPISETHGRYIVYSIAVPVGALFTLGAGFSQNIWSLCILRFFAGLAFSPTLAIGAGTLADIFSMEQRAGPSAIYILSPFLGPALGPVLGSFVTVRKSWRWTQWTLIFWAIFAQLTILTTTETYKKIIIARRNKKLGLPPPPSPFPNAAAKMKVLITITLLRPLHMLATEPLVAFLSLYTGFNFAVLFCFFAAFPYVFRTVYAFTLEQSGLVFLAIGTGCLFSPPTVLLCDRLFYQPQVRLSKAAGTNGIVAPEYRLIPSMVGSLGLPIGLFWFAWTARSDISWASPVLSAIPFAWGNLSIFIGAAGYLLDSYPATNAASAMAANGLLRYVLGAVFPLFTLQMYHKLGIGWATSLLAFIAVALMPIPWVLFKYGKTLRGRSSYETLRN